MSTEIVHESDEEGGDNFGAGGDKECHIKEEPGRRERLSGVFVALDVVYDVFMRSFVGEALLDVS
jgi:hypothetical protein